MFTGIVEEIGSVARVERSSSGKRMSVRASLILDGLVVKESININGVCLTVVGIGEGQFSVDIVEETLYRTNLSKAREGDPLNLERAMRFSDRMGGHIVQGHIDGMGVVTTFTGKGRGAEMSVELPEGLEEFVVEKGSLALDGVSLTVASLAGRIAKIALIPHTLEATTLGKRGPGDEINIEVDILAKYVKKLLRGGEERSSLSFKQLQEMGY